MIADFVSKAPVIEGKTISSASFMLSFDFTSTVRNKCVQINCEIIIGIILSKVFVFPIGRAVFNQKFSKFCMKYHLRSDIT